MRESLVLFGDPPGEQDWAAAVGGVRPATAHELPPGYSHGLRFAVPLVEMPVYLPWLVEQVRTRGGELERRLVSALSDLVDDRTDAVVNCSGLAARSLVGDTSVYPVRGQIVRVTNPGLTLSVRDEHHPAGRAYVHPRGDDCILGGTLEEHSWDTRVDLATADATKPAPAPASCTTTATAARASPSAGAAPTTSRGSCGPSHVPDVRGQDA